MVLYLLDTNYKNPDKSNNFYSDDISMRPDCIVAPAFILPRLELDKDQRKDLIAYYRLESLPGAAR